MEAECPAAVLVPRGFQELTAEGNLPYLFRPSQPLLHDARGLLTNTRGPASSSSVQCMGRPPTLLCFGSLPALASPATPTLMRAVQRNVVSRQCEINLRASSYRRLNVHKIEYKDTE
ncbi:hypothetical protein NDU88_002051 [Pleurodeles waltl]|uniref:Uncharacterized protein n=1 Tax=Pleurodeles waltl TaxID=8319 RepID=A0AAV7KTI8_PLEWA|nr:hypothetical protein NDU88_002051 [Pleurodeles waltl]